MEIQAPRAVRNVMDRLEAAGYEAWLVGGCVRDGLLGRAPQDWDVTTNARPEDIHRAMGGLETLDIGAKHGTVTVLSEGTPVEVTTYRADGLYTDHRRPETVAFSDSLEEDLARRDFTVNAMAWHPARGLMDPFGGQGDLEARLLRCVGEPARRFQEDALRILRGLRFAAVLGFALERETDRALREQRELLRVLSPERVREELTKLLCGANAAQVLREHPEVVFTALPELAPMEHCAQETRYHCWNVWEHCLHAMEAVEPSPLLRWAALLHDCGKPAVKVFDEEGVAHFRGHDKESARIADELLRRLRFSNGEREEIVPLVGRHGPPLDPPEKRVRRLLSRLGEETFFRLMAVKKADALAHAPDWRQERVGFAEKAEAMAREILARQEPLRVKDLAIGGEDLLTLGAPRGPVIGQVLNALLDRVLEGTLENERQALLERAQMELGIRN